MIKQLKKNAAGLSNAQISDFTIIGPSASKPPIRYILVKHKKKTYTLKVRSKKEVVELSMQARLRQEMKLVTGLNGHKRLMPLALQMLEDDSYIYSVMPTRVATVLSVYIDTFERGLPEAQALFFAASLVEGIAHLQKEMPVMGGVAYRNIDPNSITLDEEGVPQLIDMRFAVQAEPPPRDYCGLSHYLSPEQVDGYLSP